MKAKGTVYLVGAGPGDPGLLTLRGAELLGRAEVVVYDALINPNLLRLAPKGVETIFAGKRARDHAVPQEELNQLLVAKAREGKSVVRLKGGDPYVFGRGAEEAEELQKAGIPFEVVPGISSAIAGPNYAGIPLTHRDHCSAFSIFTGHEDPTKRETALDYDAIAKMPGTKVILMGVERIREIAQTLVARGVPATTPVALVRWATTGQQETLEGTLGTIGELVETKGFSAPAIAIIGSVVQLRSKLNWFERRPMFGQRIVVTRTRDQSSQLAARLQELGAEVLEIPTIKIVDPENRQPLLDFMQSLGEYDWVVFTSPNGVSTFFGYFFKAFDDLRALGNVRLAAVGPATAAKIRELHLRVDLMPPEYVTRKIAETFIKFETVENLKIALLRAEVANPELPEALEKLGAIVDDIPCYRTVPEIGDGDGAAAKMTEEGADWITFTSSSTVENFNARFNLAELRARFPKMGLASIGPETTRAITALGLSPEVEASDHTIDGLVAALAAHRRPQ